MSHTFIYVCTHACRFRDEHSQTSTDLRKALLTKCQQEFEAGVQARGRRGEAAAPGQAHAGGERVAGQAPAQEPVHERGGVHGGGLPLSLLPGSLRALVCVAALLHCLIGTPMFASCQALVHGICASRSYALKRTHG